MRRDERMVLMPILARGNHRHPRGGGCFAEVAATLMTHGWTDRPTCIPPVLAEIARGVNDRTRPETRTGLAPLIPWAIYPRGPGDLTGDIAVSTALIELARSDRPGDPALDRLLQRLERRPRPRHLLDRVGWRRAARHLVRAQLCSISTADESVRDAHLRGILIAAIDATRLAQGLPPLPEPVAPPVTGTHLLPVTTYLDSVDDALELRVEPRIDHWPDWIRGPWHRRLLEITPDTGDRSDDRLDQRAGDRQLVSV
jgi:hypothetical protein